MVTDTKILIDTDYVRTMKKDIKLAKEATIFNKPEKKIIAVPLVEPKIEKNEFKLTEKNIVPPIAKVETIIKKEPVQNIQPIPQYKISEEKPKEQNATFTSNISNSIPSLVKKKKFMEEVEEFINLS